MMLSSLMVHTLHTHCVPTMPSKCESNILSHMPIITVQVRNIPITGKQKLNIIGSTMYVHFIKFLQ